MENPFGWVLVAHIVGIVFWMGGLFAALQLIARQPREPSPEVQSAVPDLAGWLLKRVAHPGAAVAVLAGIGLLVVKPADLQQSWLHIKLALVFIIIILDLLATIRVRAQAGARSEALGAQARMIHGVVALLFLAVVILAVIKP